MRRSKKQIIITAAALLCAAVICAVVFAVLAARCLPKGALTVKGQTGEVLASCSENGGLRLTDNTYADYIETVLAEAAEILSEKYSRRLQTQDIFNIDAEIVTFFSLQAFDSAKAALQKMSYSDSRRAEAVICDVNGRLLASVSGGDKSVTEPHKAGSALKPLSVYAPALQDGIINLGTQTEDSPLKKINGADWPANYSGTYSGQAVNIGQAVAQSLNTVAVKTLERLTPARSCEFLEKFGIDVSYEAEYAASAQYEEVYGNLALGQLAAGVTAEQLAGCYTVFANGGKYTPAYAVSEIFCGQESIYKAQPQSDEILNGTDAEIMNLILQGVTGAGGTAENASADGLKIGGKTGTSEGYLDNWFIGFTPQYVCAVWYGYHEEQPSRGENEATAVFRDIISGLENDPSAEFPKGKNTVERRYCVYTGQLAGDGCNTTETALYNAEHLPEICERHNGEQYDR